jgi:hypothetical protein
MNFPPEIVSEIIKFLSSIQRVKARLISRLWDLEASKQVVSCKYFENCENVFPNARVVFSKTYVEGNYTALKVKGCNFKLPPTLRELSVKGGEIRGLYSINKISLTCCRVDDISCLIDVPDLYIGHVDIPSLPRFRNKKLCLIGERSVDASLFEEVKHLILVCRNIYNPKHLASVETLELSINSETAMSLLALPNLVDLSIFRGSEGLNWEFFPNIKTLYLSLTTLPSVDSLPNLESLTLEGCNIDLLRSYKQLKEINVTAIDPNEFEAFRELDKLRSVHIAYSSVTDLSVISHVPEVTLSNCYKVVDVSPLRNAFKVSICDCESVRDISALKDIEILHLHDLTLEEIPEFQGREIYLKGCVGALKMPTFPNAVVIQDQNGNVFYPDRL